MLRRLAKAQCNLGSWCQIEKTFTNSNRGSANYAVLRWRCRLAWHRSHSRSLPKRETSRSASTLSLVGVAPCEGGRTRKRASSSHGTGISRTGSQSCTLESSSSFRRPRLSLPVRGIHTPRRCFRRSLSPTPTERASVKCCGERPRTPPCPQVDVTFTRGVPSQRTGVRWKLQACGR